MPSLCFLVPCLLSLTFWKLALIDTGTVAAVLRARGPGRYYNEGKGELKVVLADLVYQLKLELTSKTTKVCLAVTCKVNPTSLQQALTLSSAPGLTSSLLSKLQVLFSSWALIAICGMALSSCQYVTSPRHVGFLPGGAGRVRKSSLNPPFPNLEVAIFKTRPRPHLKTWTTLQERNPSFKTVSEYLEISTVGISNRVGKELEVRKNWKSLVRITKDDTWSHGDKCSL